MVGEEICRELILRGHTVVGLSSTGNRDHSGDWEDCTLDLKDFETLSAWSNGLRCDAIIHAAAEIDLTPYNPNLISTNCLGTLNTLWLAEKWKADKFVFISTVQVLGDSPTSKVDETFPPNPRTTYHATKLFGENVVSSASARGVESISLRISAPIGLNMPSHRFLSVLFQRASKGKTIELEGVGARRQDYVDTRDVAIAAAQSLVPGKSGVFNVASGVSKSNLELAEVVNGLFGSRSEILLGGEITLEDNLAWDISIEKARRELAWSPSHSLSDSVEYIRNSTNSDW